MSDPLPRLLTAKQLARQTSLPLSRVYALAREGKLPVIRLGRAMRFDPDAVRAFFDDGGTAGNGSES